MAHMTASNSSMHVLLIIFIIRSLTIFTICTQRNNIYSILLITN